jgi:molybdenum cofactor biosynthesis protein B
VVLTVSDTRTPETDIGGQLIEDSLRKAGHEVLERAILPDDPPRIRAFLERALGRSEVGAVLLTGGSGVSPRDRTPETVAPLLERPLPGFGELFRSLSFEEVGPAAMLSRALGGVAGRAVVFVLPGSPQAVRLALERLIVPELAHIVGQLRR